MQGISQAIQIGWGEYGGAPAGYQSRVAGSTPLRGRHSDAIDRPSSPIHGASGACVDVLCAARAVVVVRGRSKSKPAQEPVADRVGVAAVSRITLSMTRVNRVRRGKQNRGTYV